jgi:TonB family protein
VIQLLLCFALLLGSNSAADKKSDKEQNGLKGPVGSVRVEKAVITRENQKAVEGQRLRESKTRYSGKGQMIEMVLYNGDFIANRMVFNQDPQGNTLATYLERSPAPSSTTPAAGETQPQNGVKVSKHVFKYDERGNRTEDAVYGEDGTLLSKDVYRYDEKGSNYQVGSFDADGKTTGHMNFTYDSQRMIATQYFFGQTGRLTEKRSYTYELDGQGNWIKQTTSKILDNGLSEPLEVRYRTIAYFAPVGKYTGGIVGGVRNPEPNAPTSALYTEKGMVPIEGGLLVGKILRRIDPKYPAVAATAKVEGAVLVEISIDEEGDVVGARALQGHGLLKGVAEQAALQCKFTPTTLNGEPVRAVGMLTYNFRREQ